MWYRLIFLLLCSACAVNGAAAGPGLFRQADSLCAGGRYSEAALCYEQVFFRQSDPALRGEALLYKGRCLKTAGDYSEAVRNLKRADTLQLPENLAYTLHYEAALCAYLAGNTSEAAFQLSQVGALTDSSYRDSCLLLHALVDLEGERWAEAKTAIIRYAQLHRLTIDTAQLIGSEADLHLKNVRKARLLSVIIPGMGQVYAGKPLRGVTSFILVTGSLAYGVWTVIEGYYISGTATGLGLATRFYSGGVRYAGRLAEEYNARKTEKYQEKVRGLLLKNP